MSAVNDQMGVAYSLKTFIEEETGMAAVLHYNGMELPSEFPFVKVRSVLSPHFYISKARETVKVDFNFEITLFEGSNFELNKSQVIIRNLLLFKDIPYFDSNGERVEDVFFNVNIRNENQVGAEDITDTTRKHRVYFETTVVGTFHKKNN